jgi:hypothetical protein
MAGVCSAHHPDLGPVEGCAACHSTPAQVLGVTEEEWAEKVAEAEAAGEHTCEGTHWVWVGLEQPRKPEPCGFVYYKTTDTCPRCGTKRED